MILLFFSVAFAVDPLYHQTSAQFDEGGAKGLLLNNLGVYDGCRVLFDSLEVPGNCISCANQYDILDTMDLSFAKEHIEQMVFNMHKKDKISPTLGDIIDRFNECSQRPSNTFSSGPKLSDQISESYNGNNIEFDDDAFDNGEAWSFDHDNQMSVVGEDNYGGDPILRNYHKEKEPFVFPELDVDEKFDKVSRYLFLSLGFTSKQNAWAGPDHWKYKKAKGSEDPATENGSPLTTNKPRNKREAELDIDFTKAFDKELPDTFVPPKNPNSLLLPSNKAPHYTMLPEDCHYQPEDLVKLFLLPNVMFLGRRRRTSPEEWSQQRDDYGSMPSWDDENVFGGQHDDGDGDSDAENSNTLVSQPRQVNKIEVKYDKTSKQVDVQALKETLWDHLQKSIQASIQGHKETASFKHVLASFPKDCSAAAAIRDISPHLCFICLLHLANEHGLRIQGCSNLDDLTIHFPTNT
ncbi:hypothetical protein U1Q18_001202 [Sarracenia purpurea var. burkii]